MTSFVTKRRWVLSSALAVGKTKMIRRKRSSATQAHLRIVSINDVYNIQKNLPRFQTFLAQLSPKPSAVVLCGDFLSPSLLSSIDCGRGMVATLRTIGITHVSLGNHEADLRLDSLRQRLEELSAPIGSSTSSSSSSSPLSKPAVHVVNSNMQHNLPKEAEWLQSVTQPFSMMQTACGKVNVALVGLLSDEPGIFRDNTFKSVPIQNVCESFSELHDELINKRNIDNNGGKSAAKADFIIPMTHQSLARDQELASHMLDVQSGSGVILGGHEHEPCNSIVTRHGVRYKGADRHVDEAFEDAQSSADNSDAKTDKSHIRIFKSGMDANDARVVDVTFEVQTQVPPRVTNIRSDLVHIGHYDPSPIAQQVVDKHMSVITALENEVIIDANAVIPLLPAHFELSSERTRFQQTSVGSVFCQMIKEEMEGACDLAMINGATIKGDKRYPNGKMSYSELKSELPFPTKIVTIPMKSHEVYDAILYSRTANENSSRVNDEQVARRGYLQVDYDSESKWEDFGLSNSATELMVALPRNLLNGFCNIKPLVDVGERLKKQQQFPGSSDHFVPAINLIVRHACKNKWYQLVGDNPFSYFDLNEDGVLDRHEIKEMLTEVLGYIPLDFVIDDMISSIDQDNNGVIDQGEFSYLLAQVERDHWNTAG